MHELRREPVEQLRMRRRRSLRAEVLAGLDEAAAEELLPGAVDRDARGQRVLLVDEPAREAEPVRHLIVGAADAAPPARPRRPARPCP